MEYFLGACKVCDQNKIVNEQAFCQDCCPTHLKADKEPVANVRCSVGLCGVPVEVEGRPKIIIDQRYGMCAGCKWHPDVCQYCQTNYLDGNNVEDED